VAYELTNDDPGRAIVVDRDVCGGDTLGASRDVLLTFAAPVDAAEVRARLVDLP
jgi:hypothetical protein